MLRLAFIFILVFIPRFANAQHKTTLADSVRRAYKIPELCYAVVSADSVYEMQALGVRKINTNLSASLEDRFRIGSNTKAITGFIAALLVKQGNISWNTRFFDLFPEMKATSRKEYHNLTLLNLLSFRTKLFPYTYTDPKPVKSDFTGNEEEQRYQFTQWAFRHEPVHSRDSVCFSNLSYTAAGLMLEKVSGKSYKQLVAELGAQLGIEFGFGQPNIADPLQTWGHNATLTPEPPGDNFKLNWLLPAGNINITLPDYVKFIQLQLKGLNGRSALLTREEFNFLHFGLARFAVGWSVNTDDKNNVYSYHEGNPGTFLTKVYVFPKTNKAIILFSNAQTDRAEEGMDVLLDKLTVKYGS